MPKLHFPKICSTGLAKPTPGRSVPLWVPPVASLSFEALAGPFDDSSVNNPGNCQGGPEV